MPTFLRHDAIRLFESSLESLHLAISSLGNEKRISFREPAAKWACEIGLIGAAAEQAMSACLVNAYGPPATTRETGLFKAFPEILEDFRALVTSATPKSNFLTIGVEDPLAHRRQLHDLTGSFRRLAAVRAAGFHAGSGLVWESAIVQANSVSDFLEALAGSSRIRPYLESIPRCLLFDKNRTVILEDLSRRLLEGGPNRAQTLASIFLVLPETPDEEPEWIGAFERISVAPKPQDITYLLEILERAIPATLRRTTGTGAGIAVAVRPNDVNALPIAPQYLRRQFNDIRDQWYADIGNANGRLATGILHLPPVEATRDVFALGFEPTRILDQGAFFPPHESWPFIASSLCSKGSKGTPGPYWFLVRRSTDLGQLLAQLDRASNFGTRAFRTNLFECRTGIQSIQEETPINRETTPFTALIDGIASAEILRQSLVDTFTRSQGSVRELAEEFLVNITTIQDDHSPAGPLLESILDSIENQPGRSFWARTLSEVACDIEDLPVLVRVLGENNLSSAHTAAKKALRRIDFLLYGPPAVLPERE